MLRGNQTCAKWLISGFYITGKEVHIDEQSHLLFMLFYKKSFVR